MSDWTPILMSFINSFWYLYQDAVLLHNLANSDPHREHFRRTQLCRSAMIFYVLSLEALANWSLDSLLPAQSRDFFLKREREMSFLDKWELLPKFANSDSGGVFDESKYPWTHLKELIKLRNDYIHPKHDRTAFYKMPAKGQIEALPFNEIPDGLTFKDKSGKSKQVTERDLVYRLLRIPRDPYSILPEHVDVVKKTVDDTVAELDKLLGGKLTEDGRLAKEKMTLIFPPNAKLK